MAPAGLGAGVRALLPVRLFFGATFLYAGFDKLLDPRFFDPSSPASIQAQMLVFIRVSPIAALVRVGQPLAAPIGLAIALAEIAVGLGALTGLAFRAAAWTGAILSLLFFLTASWAIRPFYYGPDLPYAAGWAALALAGHGGLFVSHRLLAWADGSTRDGPAATVTGRRGPPPVRRRRGPTIGAGTHADDSLALRDRRTILQAGVLGLLSLVAASVAVPFRSSAAKPRSGGPSGTTSDGESSPGASPVATAGPSALVSPSPPTAAGGPVVAHVTDLAGTGARTFRVPFTAAAPLPAGDPAVIVRLADGSFVAFDAVCTHAGCTVQWDAADRLLFCPCHGATFDPADRAAVIEGPTNEALASIPIHVDPASGAISLGA